jgi:hypothetical protein
VKRFARVTAGCLPALSPVAAAAEFSRPELASTERDAPNLLTYALLGLPLLGGRNDASVGELRDNGRIAYRQHLGGHSNRLSSPYILDLPARQFGLRTR